MPVIEKNARSPISPPNAVKRASNASAKETGLSREQLYRSFSEDGNPTLRTTLAVMKALGLELAARPIEMAQGMSERVKTNELPDFYAAPYLSFEFETLLALTSRQGVTQKGFCFDAAPERSLALLTST